MVWFISSAQGTSLGRFLSPVSEWWWNVMSMKESKGSGKMLKLVSKIQSCRHVCRPMSKTRSVEKMRTWSRQNLQNLIIISVSASSQQELDQSLISVAFKKPSSQRWSSLRSQRTQPSPHLSNSTRQDQVQSSVSSWTSKTRSSTQLSQKNVPRQPDTQPAVTNKLNSLQLRLNTTLELRCAASTWKRRSQTRRPPSQKKFSATSNKTVSSKE